MRFLLILCLGVLLVLAGCIGPFDGPTEQDRPVMIVVNNSANATHTFEVWVAEGKLDNKEITIRKRDDEDDYASPGGGLSGYRFREHYGYVTSIELPPNRSRLHGRYSLEPGEKNRSLVENFTVGSTIVVVVSENDRVFSLVAARCGGGTLVGLEVTSRPDPIGGVRSAYECW
jgi:hypothetical protein